MRVPLGKRRGHRWDHCGRASPDPGGGARCPAICRSPLPPLDAGVAALVSFCIWPYHQRSLGELALSVLPRAARARRRAARPPAAPKDCPGAVPRPGAVAADNPAPSPEQARVRRSWTPRRSPLVLLRGVTSNGKTEICGMPRARRWATGRSGAGAGDQPHAAAGGALRGAPPASIVSLHSAPTPDAAPAHWLLAHLGPSRPVLGTRLAVFASMPRLG